MDVVIGMATIGTVTNYGCEELERKKGLVAAVAIEDVSNDHTKRLKFPRGPMILFRNEFGKSTIQRRDRVRDAKGTYEKAQLLQLVHTPTSPATQTVEHHQTERDVNIAQTA